MKSNVDVLSNRQAAFMAITCAAKFRGCSSVIRSSTMNGCLRAYDATISSVRSVEPSLHNYPFQGLHGSGDSRLQSPFDVLLLVVSRGDQHVRAGRQGSIVRAFITRFAAFLSALAARSTYEKYGPTPSVGRGQFLRDWSDGHK